MAHLWWKVLALSPAIFGSTALISIKVLASELPLAHTLNNSSNDSSNNSSTNQQIIANKTADNENILEQVNLYRSQGGESDSLSQVTSVSQFTDVQPTDWAFQSLQSLVERYGCIAGYPNSTYRGNRALSRYEFAAGLNSCLNHINELIASGTGNLATKEDLATLQRLQEEFKTELATLRGRVDLLEARTSQLESHQFSTTTKLVGEAIFALTSNLKDSNINGSKAYNQAAFQDRIRLDLQTSFTGKDTLHTRIAAGNGSSYPGGTYEAVQTFNLFNGAKNSAYIDWLAYYFPVGNAQIYVAAAGGIQSDYVPTNSPYFQDYDGGNGALSTFASESPIYRIGGGSGAGINVDLSHDTKSTFKPTLTMGYLASTANDPSSGNGLVNGDYAGLAQLNLNIHDRFNIAATYVHGYHNTGSYLFDGGSQFLAKQGFASPVVGTNDANISGGSSSINGTPYDSNSYGLEASFKASTKVSINGFLLNSKINSLTGGGKDEVWSYGLGVALPDFGRKGNVLGLFGGAQPYLGSDLKLGTDIPYHVEAFYKYRVNDNISITPGLIWLIHPEQSFTNSNDDAVIGTLRTTFVF